MTNNYYYDGDGGFQDHGIRNEHDKQSDAIKEKIRENLNESLNRLQSDYDRLNNSKMFYQQNHASQTMIMDQFKELTEKVEKLNGKIEFIFGDSVLIHGQFIDLKDLLK